MIRNLKRRKIILYNWFICSWSKTEVDMLGIFWRAVGFIVRMINPEIQSQVEKYDRAWIKIKICFCCGGKCYYANKCGTLAESNKSNDGKPMFDDSKKGAKGQGKFKGKYYRKWKGGRA